MFLVRDIMYCKPGQARPMVKKFLALSKLSKKMGFGPMRVMTDVSAERFWTLVAEFETESVDKFMALGDSPAMKELEPLMKDYHDLVDHGKREIYKVEGWVRASICVSASRLAVSRNTVATASVRPSLTYVTVASCAARSPSTLAESHASAWPT